MGSGEGASHGQRELSKSSVIGPRRSPRCSLSKRVLCPMRWLTGRLCRNPMNVSFTLHFTLFFFFLLLCVVLRCNIRIVLYIILCPVNASVQMQRIMFCLLIYVDFPFKV